MHANGFHASGIKEITDGANVPKGSFYSYYSSKDDFAVAVLEHYWASVERDFGPFLRDGSLPPIERVAAFFRAMTDDYEQRGFAMGCFIGNMSLECADHSAETRAKLDHVLARWIALVAACLDDAQRTGELAPDVDPGDLAEVVIEAWEGAVMRGRVLQQRRPYQRFASVALPRLLGRPMTPQQASPP